MGDDGTVRIADFGLAVIMDPGSRSRSRPYRGTIQYADPALLQDETNTTLTDIWAFGWTAWEVRDELGILAVVTILILVDHRSQLSAALMRN